MNTREFVSGLIIGVGIGGMVAMLGWSAKLDRERAEFSRKEFRLNKTVLDEMTAHATDLEACLKMVRR